MDTPTDQRAIYNTTIRLVTSGLSKAAKTNSQTNGLTNGPTDSPTDQKVTNRVACTGLNGRMNDSPNRVRLGRGSDDGQTDQRAN